MRDIRVSALINISMNEMTKIWNRCWRGYYYDMSYTPDHMSAWLKLRRVSLQHSMAILVENQIAGFALLSLDGTDGWIAGACIDPEYRRKGLFTALMSIELEVARRIGLKQVYLEVLVQNHAREIYQSVGFVQIRPLNIYHVQSRISFSNRVVERCSLEIVSIEKYFEKRRAIFCPAWQRREGYLRRHVNISAVINSTGSAGALFVRDKNDLLLDAWSTTVTEAEEIIATIVLRSGILWSLTNQPEDPIAAFLEARGIYPRAKQYEMCIELT